MMARRQGSKIWMDEAPRRLRRAEAVLQQRTNRLLLVLERPADNFNVQAVLRTAEAFGIQNVWIVDHVRTPVKLSKSVTKGSFLWLTMRHFVSAEDCIEALQQDDWEIWSTDLHPSATKLTANNDLHPFPPKVALVVGRESDGVSAAMLEASARRLFLPMHGFTESFNLSVATALVLQRCFDACPELRGAMTDVERATVRLQWYQRLAGSRGQLHEYEKWLEHPPEPLGTVRPAEEFRRARIPKKLKRKLAGQDLPDPE